MSQAPKTASLAEINKLERSGFVDLLGDIFEHSPWIAEAAGEQRPFASIDHLHHAMIVAVEGSSQDRKLALLRAHPELAGKEATAGALTKSSTDEQSSAGLNALSPDEIARLSKLNTAYQGRFGFPFIIAVRRHTKMTIFAELERRLGNEPAIEIDNNLQEIAAITRLRLDERTAGGAQPTAIPPPKARAR